jgi:uncharacterized cofD-like protein
VTEPGRLRAVAIGGGTGLPRVLRALLALDAQVSAVVTMADDGGSSGWLRREFGILPPGDARNCLAALADPGNELARVFQYRFETGEGLAGHALGNLVIAALADMEGGFPEALAVAERLLGARGVVLPSTLEDVKLSARGIRGGRITGQAAIARSDEPIASVSVDPPDPAGYPPAVDAILHADLVIVGPGSLFTSIAPNFLVADIARALAETRATRVYLCNVANQRGETVGMDADDHVGALSAHGLDGSLDVVVVHDTDRYPLSDTEPHAVEASSSVCERIVARGPRVIAADIVDETDRLHHDPVKIASVLRDPAIQGGR